MTNEIIISALDNRATRALDLTCPITDRHPRPNQRNPIHYLHRRYNARQLRDVTMPPPIDHAYHATQGSNLTRLETLHSYPYNSYATRQK